MKHIAKRRIKNTAQLLAILGVVGLSSFGMSAHAQTPVTTDGLAHTQNQKPHTFEHKTKIVKTPLTDAQKVAFKEAKALRDVGKKDEAKAVLEKAGITKRGMKMHHNKTHPSTLKTTTQ